MSVLSSASYRIKYILEIFHISDKQIFQDIILNIVIIQIAYVNLSSKSWQK